MESLGTAEGQPQTPVNVEEGRSSAQEERDGIEWKPGRQEYAVMITIATVSLMVALDATILVPVLPVSIPFHDAPAPTVYTRSLTPSWALAKSSRYAGTRS